MAGIETKDIEWTRKQVKMFPDEAVLVYLALKDVAPGKRDEKVFQYAWRVIHEAAQRNIEAFYRNEE